MDIRKIHCTNCNEIGHILRDCIEPITSYGIIAYMTDMTNNTRQVLNTDLKNILKHTMTNESLSQPIKDTSTDHRANIKLLMIQRRDTIGYIDFIRGKWNSKEALSILFREMTVQEQANLLNLTWDEIWDSLWRNHKSRSYKNEYNSSFKKFTQIDLLEIVEKYPAEYIFQEFGFPKGRRNIKESDLTCAKREFMEETGYNDSDYELDENLHTIVEEFTGTNGIRYRHVYYLAKMKNNVHNAGVYTNTQKEEIRNIGWFNFYECLSLVRSYDTAKKDVVRQVYTFLESLVIKK